MKAYIGRNFIEYSHHSKAQLLVNAIAACCLVVQCPNLVVAGNARCNKLILATYHEESAQTKHVPLLLTCLLQDLCRKCIKHNASCGKAWERLGSILEREQAYKVEH